MCRLVAKRTNLTPGCSLLYGVDARVGLCSTSFCDPLRLWVSGRINTRDVQMAAVCTRLGWIDADLYTKFMISREKSGKDPDLNG